MMIHNFVISFFIISVAKNIFSQAESTQVVYTKYGPVRGEVLETVQNEIRYSSFKGIPYAEPPVGDYRFQPPQNPTSWTEVLDVLDDPNPCPQLSSFATVMGEEDCLYLNVYTPEIELQAPKELKAVMVYIYGGGYAEGSVDSSYLGPDFLIEKDVVVVLMNYRLGALGFLTLGNEMISGNAGLKDQVLALKWVNENIDKFAGDPNKVTIFGGSAGAAAVELHHLSPLSRGLFRASIAMSGSPLNPWAFNELPLAKNISIERIQTLISDFDPNKKEDISELYDIPYEKFVRLIDIGSVDSDGYTFAFAPTVEEEGTQNEPFIINQPFWTYVSGDFYHVPHILGYMSNETVSFVGSLLPSELGENKTALDLLTYFNFRIGINMTRQFMINSNSAPVFYYRNAFEYPEILHKVEGIPLDGSGHGDDTAYIFYVSDKDQPLDPSDEVSIFRNKFITLWTNFAKYLDPSASFEDGTEIQWPQTDEPGRLLLLNSTFEVLTNDRLMIDMNDDD